MKRWKEAAEILGRVVALGETGRRAALSTVIRIEGSAYRRPGARFLVEEDGRTSGGVSGGCLEADVREAALHAIAGEAPRLLHYDTGSDDRMVWGLGLGCNGSVDIFVQPATTRDALELAGRIRELLEGDAAFALSTVVTEPLAGRALVLNAGGRVAGTTGDPDLDREVAVKAAERLSRRDSGLHDALSAKVFTEVLAPPPSLVIFGAGDDAIPLCAYAADAGFRVTVVDHRPALLSAPRFPGARLLFALRPEEGIERLPLGPRAGAVVKMHSFLHDREWVRRLLPSGVPYIGVLGPRARTREILRQIGADGGGRVYGPAGLDLGAEGPEQVALSIVAELLAVRSSREPWPLREKEGAIHGS